jgi:hypothetical protein
LPLPQYAMTTFNILAGRSSRDCRRCGTSTLTRFGAIFAAGASSRPIISEKILRSDFRRFGTQL